MPYARAARRRCARKNIPGPEKKGRSGPNRVRNATQRRSYRCFSRRVIRSIMSFKAAGPLVFTKSLIFSSPPIQRNAHFASATYSHTSALKREVRSPRKQRDAPPPPVATLPSLSAVGSSGKGPNKRPVSARTKPRDTEGAPRQPQTVRSASAPRDRGSSSTTRGPIKRTWSFTDSLGGSEPPFILALAASRIMGSKEDKERAASLAEAAVLAATDEITRREALLVRIPPPSTRAERLVAAAVETALGKSRAGHMLTKHELQLLEREEARRAAESKAAKKLAAERQNVKVTPRERQAAKEAKAATSLAKAEEERVANERVLAEQEALRTDIEEKLRSEAEAEDTAELARRRREIEAIMVADAVQQDEEEDRLQREFEERRRVEEEEERIRKEAAAVVEAEKAARVAAAAAAAGALAAAHAEKVKASRSGGSSEGESSAASSPRVGRRPVGVSPLNSARGGTLGSARSGSPMGLRSGSPMGARSGIHHGGASPMVSARSHTKSPSNMRAGTTATPPLSARSNTRSPAAMRKRT